MRTSSLTESRRARYSRGERIRAGRISYFGWLTEVAGLRVIAPSPIKYLKKDLMELSLREILFRVYLLSLRDCLNCSRWSVVTSLASTMPRLLKKTKSWSRSLA